MTPAQQANRVNWPSIRAGFEVGTDVESVNPLTGRWESGYRVKAVEYEDVTLARGGREHDAAIHCVRLRCPSREIPITRTRAAELIDRLRSMLASVGTDDQRSAQALAIEIERVLHNEFQIPELVACRGEAHSNAYIDNCAVCMPRWGFVGPKVRVR